jgi:hypothetical protein
MAAVGVLPTVRRAGSPQTFLFQNLISTQVVKRSLRGWFRQAIDAAAQRLFVGENPF